MRGGNPYNWQSHHPGVEIPRPLAGEVLPALLEGGSAVVLGGRGMGKSVFLGQLADELGSVSDLRVLLVSGPPMELSARTCLEQLAEVLEVPAAGALGTRKLLDAYFDKDVPGRLVLLFDELDRYAESRGPASSNPPGRAFFNDLELSRRNLDGLGVLATGSLAVFTFRDSLGSSFLSRADRHVLRPFDHGEIKALARPFETRSPPLPLEVLDALYVAGGGHPALTTYGLGALWSRPRLAERDVAAAFLEFQARNRDFLLDFQLSFGDPRLSSVPHRVWELIRQGDGSVARSELLEACGGAERDATGQGGAETLWLDSDDVLDLLQAAGLVRLTGSKLADPVLVSPIASILTLPKTSSHLPGFKERFLGDLLLLLSRLHASSADFFRPGSQGEGKRLVPESVFAGFLAMGFELLGWRVEREAQSVVGRTDVRLRRNGSPETAMVEVKIWGRGDYKDVQRQVESYWSAETTAGAVVMLTDRDVPDWAAAFLQRCLSSTPSPEQVQLPASSPVESHWRSPSPTADSVAREVDHFLLRLPRGRR